jgi:uncharacterized protein (DUF885 family)
MNLKNRFSLFVAISFFISLTLSACSSEDKPDEQTATKSISINTILDDYFEESTVLSSNFAIFRGDYRFNNTWVNYLSDEYLQKKHQLTKKYLALITGVAREQLSAEEQISFDVLLWDLNLKQSSEQFPSELVPINQFGSQASSFAQLGSGQSAQPFNTVKDYDDFLLRMEGFLEWMHSAEQRMQQGIKEAVVQPRALMTKVVKQLQAIVSEDPAKSIFWGPIKNMPETFSAKDKQRLTTAYSEAIKSKLNPAYQRLSDFVKNVYLPSTRESSGISALPQGKEWYQWYIKYHTTVSNLTADEIHQTGLDEVKRIHAEMNLVKTKVGFKGSLQDFFKHLQTDPQFYFTNNDEVFERYKQVRKIVAKVIPKFFDVTPKTDFEIRPIEAFRAESAAGASYQPGTPDGKRAGIFYVNTFNLKAQPIFGVETLYLHEAVPGHHFQISLAQEQQSLPKYRRFNDYTAFSEGWALYAESIGKEMGLFTDPYQYYGRLSDELLRAMRLVMDTGLHAKGWSREKAIAYMLQNSSMAESDVIAEVERYMAIPGQAVSYKIGQLRISKIRNKAQIILGDKFDVREFHNQVLLSGALPMSVLEAKIDRWVASYQ